uniref:Uncharacterized protein n=1 Tax=Oryza glumipatula TaxID=40148 RepID=A0A0E0BHV8_9ORYZ
MVVGGGNSEKEVGDRDGAGELWGGSGAVEIVGGGGEHAVNITYFLRRNMISIKLLDRRTKENYQQVAGVI